MEQLLTRKGWNAYCHHLPKYCLLNKVKGVMRMQGLWPCESVSAVQWPCCFYSIFQRNTLGVNQRMQSCAHVWTNTFHQMRGQHVWPFALRTLAHEQPHAALGRSSDVAMAGLQQKSERENMNAVLQNCSVEWWQKFCTTQEESGICIFCASECCHYWGQCSAAVLLIQTQALGSSSCIYLKW